MAPITHSRLLLNAKIRQGDLFVAAGITKSLATVSAVMLIFEERQRDFRILHILNCFIFHEESHLSANHGKGKATPHANVTVRPIWGLREQGEKGFQQKLKKRDKEKGKRVVPSPRQGQLQWSLISREERSFLKAAKEKRGGNQRRFAVIFFLFELFFFFLLPSFFSMLYTSQTYDRSCWPANT